MSRRPPPPPPAQEPSPPPSDDESPPLSDESGSEDEPDDEDIEGIEPPPSDDEDPPGDDPPDSFDEGPSVRTMDTMGTGGTGESGPPDSDPDEPDFDSEPEPEDMDMDGDDEMDMEGIDGDMEGEMDPSEPDMDEMDIEGMMGDGDMPEEEGPGFPSDEDPDFDENPDSELDEDIDPDDPDPEDDPEMDPDDESELDGPGEPDMDPDDPEEDPDMDLDDPEEDPDMDDLMSEPDITPPPKTLLNLPVRPAQKAPERASAEAKSVPNLGLESLSSGLLIKSPPKLLVDRRSVKAIKPSQATLVNPKKTEVAHPPPPSRQPPPPSAGEGGDKGMGDKSGAGMGMGGMGDESGETKDSEDPAAVRTAALGRGGIQVQGKFEGDSFETLFVRVDTATSTLFVTIVQGMEVEFDLSSRAYVFEDTADPTSLMLDYHKNLLVFKFESASALLGLMRLLPPAVFMVAELTQQEKDMEGGGGGGKGKAKGRVEGRVEGVYEGVHLKGQSVEDLLEEGYSGVDKGGAEQLQMMFTGGQVMGMGAGVVGCVEGGRVRKAEMTDHIRRPQYSVRRVTLLCEWINSLHIWPHAVTIPSLHGDMCNGLLLARIVKTVNPAVQFLNLNERALAKKPALQNLEQALGHIWRSKSLNNSRIPTALEIYVGNTSKTAILLNEMFGVYVQKPLYKNSMRILKWYNGILRQYSRPLPAKTLEGDLSGIWPHFQSGTALFLVIYHLFGPTLVGSGSTVGGGVGVIRVDPLRVAGNPSSICDYRDNLFYVYTLLEALGVDVVWTPEDWISNPDTEFMLLQLSYIYEAFKHKQSGLPPAQGATAGMTSGPNGEPLVVGLIFSDSRPASARLTSSTRKAVLLGHDTDSMPLLPIDRGGKMGRFISSLCPMGMISNNAQISQIRVLLRENRVNVERVSWNQSASTVTSRDSAKTAEVLGLLREHNKRSADGSSTLTALAAVPTASLVPVNGPGTLASGKLLTSQWAPPLPNETVDFGRVHSATLRKVNGDAEMQTQVQRKGKEIETAVAALEAEMGQSQQQLSMLEEELANRYLELEANAVFCSAEEFEGRFDGLEGERRALEDEKLQLQTHFAFKLASIKDIYSEAEQRVRVAMQENQMTRVTHKGVTTVVWEEADSHSPKKRPVERGPIDVALAERSWSSVLKPSTHNYHLRNLQAASTAAVESIWTPKGIREKDKLRRAQALADAPPPSTTRQFFYAGSTGPAQWGGQGVGYVGGLEGGASPGRSDGRYHGKADHLGRKKAVEGVGAVGVSFDRFRYRLKLRSAAWRDGSSVHGDSVHGGSGGGLGGMLGMLGEHIHSPPASPSLTLISMPHRTSTASLGLGVVGSQETIRHEEEVRKLGVTISQEEGRRMAYEDERRRLVVENATPPGPHTLTPHTSQGFPAGHGPHGHIPTRTPFGASAFTGAFAGSGAVGGAVGGMGGMGGGSRVARPARRASVQAAAHGMGAYTADYASASTSIFTPSTPSGVGNVGMGMADSFTSMSIGGMGGSLAGVGGGTGAGGGVGPPSAAEVDAAYKWVGIPRPLTIAERIPKEYVFMVVLKEGGQGGGGQGGQGGSGGGQLQYVLEWYENSRAGGRGECAGSVNLADALSVTSDDAMVFCLSLGSSAYALRQSKGRTSLAVRCGSPGECAKYLTSLRTIWRSLH